MAANLDPLGLQTLDVPEDLTLTFHELDTERDRQIFVGGVLGLDWTTAKNYMTPSPNLPVTLG